MSRQTQTQTQKGVPTRDFDDAGTGEHFTAGQAHDFDLGAHGNYLAAGLIADGDRSPAKPAD